jgi:hypothetical protein
LFWWKEEVQRGGLLAPGITSCDTGAERLMSGVGIIFFLDRRQQGKREAERIFRQLLSTPFQQRLGCFFFSINE